MKSVEFITLTRDLMAGMINEFIRMSQDVPHENWQEKQYMSDLPGKWKYSLVCLSNGQPVGYMIASEKEHGSIHIHKFIVSPSLRGKGFGTLILQKFTSIIPKAVAKVTLKLYTDNTKGLDFYIAHGFIITGESNGLYKMELAIPQNTH